MNKIKRFLHNLFRPFYALRVFWKSIRKYRRWDYTYYLHFLRDGIKDQAEFLRDHGIEVPEDRLPHVDKMFETVFLLDEIIEGGDEDKYAWDNVWKIIESNMRGWWD